MEAIIAIGAAVAVLTLEQELESVLRQERLQRRSQDSRRQRVRSLRI